MKLLFFILAVACILILVICLLWIRRAAKRQYAALAVKLQKDNSLIEDTLNRISDGFVALDRNWKVTYFNKASASFTGRNDLLGKNIWEAMPDVKGSEFYDACHKAMADQAYVYQESYYPVSGIWFAHHIYPSPQGLSIHTHNITSRKETKDRIMQSQEKFETLVNTVDGVVWEGDAQTFHFSFVSPQAERILGYPVQRWLDEPSFWKDHIHPDDRDWAVSYCAGCTLDNRSHRFEYRMLAADGKVVWLRDIVTVLSENGRPVKLRGLMIDITEKKIVEEALELSVERFETISGITHDAIWDWNIETGELWANEIHQQLYGLGKKDTVPVMEEWQQRIHPDDREQVIIAQEEALSSGRKYWESEYRFRKPDGGYAFLFDRCYVIRDEAGRAVRLTGSMMDITERKKAEEEIKERAVQLHNISNSIPGIITYQLVRQPNGEMQFTYISDSVKNIAGITAKEVLDDRQLLYNLVHTDDLLKLRAAEETSLRNMSVIELEFRSHTVAGDLRWFYLRSVPRLLPGGIVKWDAVLMDITEKKLLEEEMLRTNARFLMQSKATTDIIWEVNLSEQKLWWNDNYYTQLGYSKTSDFVTLDDWYDHVHPEERAKVKAAFLDAIYGTASVWRDEYRYQKADGTYLHILDRGYILRDEENGPYGMIGSMVDMTSFYEAQQRIVLEKQLSDSLINNLPGLFYLFTAEGRLLRWNKNMEIASGYSAEEVGQMHPLDFFDANERSVIAQKIEEVFTTKGYAWVEADYYTKDGRKIPYYWNGWNINYEGQTCLIGTGIDITEKKEAQNKLIALNNQLKDLYLHQQGIVEETKKRIAREIHDELGQQLTVLKMDISWLCKRIEHPSEKVNERIRELISMADNTIKSLRRISSELRPSMLDDLGLQAAIEWHAQEFEKRSGITLETDISVTNVKFPDDVAITLFRIFQECLTNVARHAEATRVNVDLSVKEGILAMHVKDNGKGFLPESIENKKTLGILGMRERVQIIGGEYTISSKPGNGTAVEVKIPLVLPV